MNNKARFLRVRLNFSLEAAMLGMMLLTLVIPSNKVPIALWMDLSPLIFVRALVWFLGLLVLPGLYLLSLMGIAENLSRVVKITIGINLSLVLVGLVGLILYYAQGSIIWLPWLLLAILSILGVTNWFKRKPSYPMVSSSLSKWHLTLIGTLSIAVLIAFSVQLAQRYLIPGDIWISLKPAVEVISQRDVYESFSVAQYPVMFGFILASLSVCTGLPAVNTYVLLFPLVALNTLSFFTLVKMVFNMDDKIAVIASIIYNFSAGFGWVIQIFIYDCMESMWGLNFLTQDIYFAMAFWNTMQFSHRTLGLTFVYTSLALFTLSIKFKNALGKMIILVLTSLLMLFSFFVHITELLIIGPVIFVIAYIYQKGTSRYTSLVSPILAVCIMGYLIDSMMSGYYSWLLRLKVEKFFPMARIDGLLTYSLLLFGAIFIFILIRHFLPNQLRRLYAYKNYLRTIKLFFVVSLIIIYLCGLWFLTPLAWWETTSVFPWYLYVTRYGFIGILALIGVGVARWREKWFNIASFWCLLTILVGSLWWGSKINAYLFPMLALLAAVAIEWIWKKAMSLLYITVATETNSFKRSFKLNPKPVMTTLIVAVLALSFTSVIYGIGYYASIGPSISDDEARAFLWIYQNVPENDTVLVPQIYTISKGIDTISDRQIYESVKLPTTVNSLSFVNLTKTFHMYNVTYAVSVDGFDEPSLVRLLLSYSTLLFQSGNVKVFKLPPLNPPSQEYTVAIVDRELLGLSGETHSFGWVDDSLTEGWSYKNVNAASDGEILTFRWKFHSGDYPEPSMKKIIFPVETNEYPYIIVRYRNTAETTATAENNVGQIITLVNQTDYPKGFIKNFFLPISKEKGFCIFTAKLPENQDVAEVGIWLRNYKRLNGTVGLQIDFIGFASSENIFEDPDQMRFLSLALPALWPANHSIFSNSDEVGNAPVLVSTYDKNILNYIENATHTNTFVFLNHTAVFPPWGTDWRNVKPGIISGYMEDKKIIILGVAFLQGDISDLAESIYEEISR